MKYDINFQLELKQNTYPGKYYAIEGIDGSGKTTQTKMLAEYFSSQGKQVLMTKEPTDGLIGKLIYQVLHKELSVPPISLQYLFCADRAVHLEEVVTPALKEGKIVISDRSLWSAVAYGITDQNLPDEQKERILVAYNAVLALYGGFLIPDITILLDIPFEVSLERTEIRNQTKSIYDGSEKLRRIIKEYLFLAHKFPEVITRVEGDHHHTPEQIQEKILKALRLQS